MDYSNIEKIFVYSIDGKKNADSVQYIEVKRIDKEDVEKIEKENAWKFLSGYYSSVGAMIWDGLDEVDWKDLSKKEKKEEKKEEKAEKDEKSEKKEEKKDSKKGVAKRVGSIIVALAIGAGSYALVDSYINKKKGLDRTKQEQQGQFPYSNEPIISSDNGYLPVNNPYNSQYYANSQAVYDAGNMGEKLERLIKFDPMTSKELYNNIDDFNLVIRYNMKEVCDVINGGTMTGTRYTLAIKYCFPIDSPDYLACEYFENIRNNGVVDEAYKNNASETAKDVKAYINAYVDFCLNEKPLDVNNQRIFFRDLSPVNRYYLAGLGAIMAECPVDYTGKVGNVDASLAEIRQEAYSFWGAEMGNLENSMRNGK